MNEVLTEPIICITVTTHVITTPASVKFVITHAKLFLEYET